MENKIDSLRISKAQSGKSQRESDKPANEKLIFKKVSEDDVLIESEFYIHRLKVADILNCMLRIFPEKF